MKLTRDQYIFQQYKKLYRDIPNDCTALNDDAQDCLEQNTAKSPNQICDSCKLFAKLNAEYSAIEEADSNV